MCRKKGPTPPPRGQSAATAGNRRAQAASQCRECCVALRTLCGQLAARLVDCLSTCFAFCRVKMCKVKDIKHLRFWRGVLAEFLAVLLLIILGCGACANVGGDDKVVKVALVFGFTTGILIYAIGNISGGHLNPAFTVALLVTRRISVLRCLLYILAQMLGAIIGAAILYGLTPWELQGNMGVTVLHEKVTPEQGFGIEFFISLLLVFIMFAAGDAAKGTWQPLAPLVIGLAVAAGHLYAYPLTTASMNTARSFGPAVIKGKFESHWVYWFGPLLGGIAGGILYDVLFDSNATLRRTKQCLLAKEQPGNGSEAGSKRAGDLPMVVRDPESGASDEKEALKSHRSSLDDIEEAPSATDPAKIEQTTICMAESDK